MSGAMAPSTDKQEVSNLVTFMSYNSTGMNSVKCEWINEISSEYDVDYLAIQEHFKSTKTTDKFFRQKYKDYNSYVIPGFRPPGQDNGRARAGIAQLSRKCLAVKKDRILTHSYRIQAQLLNFPMCKILWINSYFPTDPQVVQNYDPSDLLDLLREVEVMLANNEFTDVVWAGDLNWDMSRNSQFSVIMKDFVSRLGVEPLWSQHSVDFTHLHTDNKSTSTIDHFLLSPRLLPLIAGAGVIHRGDNLSRHSPILLKLKLGDLPRRHSCTSKSPIQPSWLKATSENIELYSLW